MRARILVILAILGCVSAGLAQQASSADAPATKEQVLKFMDIMHLKVAMTQMVEGMKGQARLGAEHAFKQKVPDATAAQLEKVDAIADEMFNSFPVDEMLDAVVPIYQKHLSQADLDAVIKFYSSPTGQKFVREMPAMMQEGMQAGGDLSRRRMEEVSRRIDQKIDDLVKESGAPSK